MSVVELKPKASVKHSRGGGLGARVDALEARMTAVEADIKTAVANTAEVLSILRTAKGIAGFARKHGRATIGFVAGLLAAAGVGNPEIWHFIQHFFGN